MKLRFTYGCLFLIIQLQVTAQQNPKPTAGELWMSLQKTSADTNRITALLELGRFYLARPTYGNDTLHPSLDTAAMLFNKAIILGDSLSFTKRRRAAMINLGEAYVRNRKTAEGKKLFEEVAAEYRAQKNFQWEGTIRYHLAKVLPRTTDNFPAISESYQRSIALFREVGNSKDEGIARMELADIYFQMEKLNIAEEEGLKAVTLFQRAGYKNLYDVYYILSVINRYKGELDKSLTYAIRSLQNAEEMGADKNGFFTAELALVYEQIGKPEESIRWYRLALEKREATNTDHNVLFRTAGLLSRQLIKLKKEKEALALLNDLEKKYPPVNSWEKATVHQFKAYCYDALNQFENAETNFLAMEKNYAMANSNDGFITIGYGDLGRFYLKHHQYEKAHQYLVKGQNGLDIPAAYRMDVLLLLFRADSAMGKYQQAVNDLQQYEALKDSIFNDKKAKQIEELQIQYETAKKEKEIIQLNNKNKAQQITLRNSALVRNIIIGGILLLLGFFYYRYRLKQKINRQLEEQQGIINRKNVSLENLVKEKEWLVKEIHHRVKNNFHIVQGLLGTQSGYLKSEEAISALTDSRHRVQAMSLIHQKLYQSDNMSAINMRAYIHELVSYLTASFNTGNSIQFKLEIDPVELDLTHCIPLGLIMNEAITNSIKYAFPDQAEKIISVSFTQEQPDHFSLYIQDNGMGMPKDFSIQHASSMGMKLMRGLSEDIDAEFSIHSKQGTEIRLRFIYEPEASALHNTIKPALTDSI